VLEGDLSYARIECREYGGSQRSDVEVSPSLATVYFRTDQKYSLRPYQSNPDDLKAGFERYGDGRIPTSYLPEKIDLKVPGGESLFKSLKRHADTDCCCSDAVDGRAESFRARSGYRGTSLHLGDLIDTDIFLKLMIPLVYPMKFYDFQGKLISRVSPQAGLSSSLAPSLSAMSLYV
jgi:hypothetical protein